MVRFVEDIRRTSVLVLCGLVFTLFVNELLGSWPLAVSAAAFGVGVGASITGDGVLTEIAWIGSILGIVLGTVQILWLANFGPGRYTTGENVTYGIVTSMVLFPVVIGVCATGWWIANTVQDRLWADEDSTDVRDYREL